MAAVRGWLEAVVLVSMLLTVAETLVPEGNIRKIAGFTGGVILMLTLLQPILRTDIGRLRLDFDSYSDAIEERQAELETEENKTLSGLIAEKSEAYISDKAAELGMEVRVTVRTELGEDGVPYPAEAEVTGPQSEALAAYIEDELGIPQERQVWHGKDE